MPYGQVGDAIKQNWGLASLVCSPSAEAYYPHSRIQETGSIGMIRSRVTVGALVAAFSLLGAACAGGGTTQPATAPTTAAAPPTTALAKTGPVTPGTMIGTLPTAPGGWAPPATLTPVNPLPGMFQSVGTTPQPQVGKVRVFFLGMQW
jgi:hypothetical protein